MDEAVQQDLLLHQVMTGTTRCLIINTPYYVCAASPAHKLEAQHIYMETLYECSFQEVLTQEEMLDILIKNEFWSAEKENELQSAPARLDALKVDMYQRFVNSPTGRVCTAIRENENRAQMLGYNTFHFKLIALIISSITAALAGTFCF